jgi:hypothetical protein
MADTLGPAEGRYRQLEPDRFGFLDRARDCAQYTIPALMPPDGFTPQTKLYQPYQGIGARGVNNLASKLLLALLPPNSPFFRFRVNPFVAEEMQQTENAKAEVDKALAKVERAIMEEIEGGNDRVVAFEMLKHLLVAGNVLLYLGKDGTRIYPLDKYVCKRDGVGNLIEAVTKESVAPAALPKNVLDLIGHKLDDDRNKTVDIFTHIKRDGDMFRVCQEVKGFKIPGSDGSYPVDKSPWLALRLIRIDGEDYGRSFVEEYLGDLKSLEALTRSIVEGSAAAAKMLFLVKPGGSTRAETLAKAPNGAIREGNADDVTVLQVQKFNDFRVALETMTNIEQRLAHAFLLNSSVTRDAERVTAEEVRLMAQELEDALGGVYGILSQEFQLPYVNRKMAVMQKAGVLPKMPKGVVKVAIVTGLEALGRGHDRNKLVNFLATVSQALGAEAVARYINVGEALSRLATADGIDHNGLIKSDQQIAEEDQMAQQQAQLDTYAPMVVEKLGAAMVAQQKQGNTNGPQQ